MADFTVIVSDEVTRVISIGVPGPPGSGSANIDGGAPDSIYGGTTAIDGGTP